MGCGCYWSLDRCLNSSVHRSAGAYLHRAVLRHLDSTLSVRHPRLPSAFGLCATTARAFAAPVSRQRFAAFRFGQAPSSDLQSVSQLSAPPGQRINLRTLRCHRRRIFAANLSTSHPSLLLLILLPISHWLCLIQPIPAWLALSLLLVLLSPLLTTALLQPTFSAAFPVLPWVGSLCL